MAEGINFSSESFDDDAESSSEPDNKKKKKKKASRGLGAAIFGSSLEKADTTPESTEQPKPSFFDQLRGWLSDAAPEQTVTKIADAKDVENLRTVASNEEDAAIARASEVLSTEAPLVPEQAVDFSEFRTELDSNELSTGEGVIELHSANAEAAAFEASVEGDLALIEPVESPDENATVRQAPSVLARALSGTRNSSSRHAQGQSSSGSGRPMGGAPGAAGGAGGSQGSGTGNQVPLGPNNPNIVPGQQGGNIIPNNPNALPALLLAQRLAVETAHMVGRTKGRVEGLIAGAVIGGGVEHVSHKRHEKKTERQTKEAFARRDQKIESLEYNHQQLKTNQLEMARKAEADKRQIREAAQAEMARTVEEQMTLARSENGAVLEAAKRAAELKEEEHKKAETIERLNSQAMEQEKQEAERLQGPENRLETSAWHTMEVDKHGHVVEDSKIEYGHEYYRERSHEIAPQQQVDETAGIAAVSSLVGGAGTTTSDDATQISPGWAPQTTSVQVPTTSQSQAEASEHETLDVAALLPWVILLIAVGLLIWLLA